MSDITASFYYSTDDFTTGSLLPIEPVSFLHTIGMVTGGLNLTQNLTELFSSQFFLIESNEERPILYKFRGYNTSSLAFEYWTGESQTAPQPSGNPLIDVTIVGRLFTSV